MLDDKKTAEILATCDSIGYSDEDKYFKDPDCLDCVKDLVYHLRRDDDDHSVRRLLGQAQVVQRDLLPLLKHYPEDLELTDFVLRVLVNLTHPAFLLYDQEIPKNKTYLSYYLEIEGYLRAYKAAFVDKLVWKRLTDRLRVLLNLEWDKQMADDKNALERILTLIRNVLMVAADPAEEKRTDDENSLHDRILMVMHLSGIEDLLLFMSSSDSMQIWCINILEIISAIMREQTGEQVAKTQLIRNEEDMVKDERELIRIRERETALKTIQMQKASTRHSRFGGTFTVKDTKAPSGKDLLCHKPITSTADLTLDATKKTKKTASNRMPLREDDPTRRSTIPVRIILKEFCSEFIEAAYNHIMHVVKSMIVREKAYDHDETYYLWAMKFFMEFNRHHNFKVSYVSETMSTATFHYVQTLLDNYHSMMVTDKEKIPFWSRRAHMALRAYQELLFTLLWMDKCGNETVKESSRVIKSNVFYQPEYRELCYGLLNTYDPVKLSKFYLKDLVETNHLFLKMLEEYSSSSRKILIKTKGKKRRKKKGTKAARKHRKFAPKDEDELVELWDKIAEDVNSAVDSGETPDEDANVIPFDVLSDVPIEEQKVTAVERIAVFVHVKKYKEAVALLRASREVWPDCGEDFGELGIESLEETLVLKSIFMNKAAITAVNSALRELDDQQENEEKAAEQAEEEEEDEFEEEEEEEVVQTSSKEQEFDFEGFVLKYATPKIVANYSSLFKDWESLKQFTLHCVMKMFHRFVFQMDYPALICQASIFRVFQKILLVAPYQSELKEISKFFYHFWPKFVKLCEKNNSMFVEILFWKTSREAQEIQDGYGSAATSSSQKKKPDKNSWTTEEENELVLLGEEYNGLPDEAKRATKIVEWINERWTGRPKSKKMMISKLVEKDLIDATSNVKMRRAPKTWQDEELEKLRELYPEHKESSDIMASILEEMPFKRSKKVVIQKMLEIGLIDHKDEVKKKRVRGARGGKRRQTVSESGSADANEMEHSRPVSRSSRSSSSSSSSGSDSEPEANHSDAEPSSSGYSSSNVFNAGKVIEFLKDLVTEGMEVSVRWVLQSVVQFKDDLIEFGESDDSVPLVPIGADCISAMSKSNMKGFMKSLGLQPPGDQETFWRIPGSWNQSATQARIDILEDTLKSANQDPPTSLPKTSKNMRLIESEEDENQAPPKSRVNNNDDELSQRSNKSDASSLLQNKKQIKSRSRIRLSSNSSSSSSSSSSSVSTRVSQLSKATNSSVLTDADKNGTTNNSESKQRKSLKRIVVDSDSDDDITVNNQKVSDIENSPVKANNSSRLVDSDDEGEAISPTTKPKARTIARIVDSDED